MSSHTDNAANEETPTEGSSADFYVWSPRYIDSAILRDSYNSSGTLVTADRVYYLADANYNVTALVGVVTTENGDAWQVVERYTYTPYGEVTYCDSAWTAYTNQVSVYSNTTLFAGRTLDTATDLYYNRARYYDASLERFISRDPIGYVQSSNLYQYAKDNPAIMVDPTGFACSETTITPISHGMGIPSVSVNLGAFFVQAGLDVSGTYSHKTCDKCCSDGRRVKDDEVSVAVEVTGKIAGGFGTAIDIHAGAFPFDVSGYAGIKIQGEGKASISGGGATDRCNGIDTPRFKACGSLTVSARISGGISVSFSAGWFSWDIAGEVYGSQEWTIGQICYDCSSGSSCHWTSTGWERGKAQIGYKFCFGACVTAV